MSYNPKFSGTDKATASASVQNSELNNSGGTLTKLMPVRINTSGDIDAIDVSSEAQALAVAGLVDSDIADGSSGNVVGSGRILDITTTAALGDVLYVAKSGGVTNVKPSVGVAGFVEGDFVIKLGIVAKNQSNPSDKDLIVNISIVGQL